MSKLQAALRAYPTGTNITGRMAATDKIYHRLMDREREREINTARWIMRERGCTWGEALRLLRNSEVQS